LFVTSNPQEQAKGFWAQDLLASVVVFLVALPLCMGIAIASGAPPAAGLITGIIGGIVAGSLSGCPLQVSGPAAGLAVIVYELIQKHGFAALGPIIVLAGLIQLAAGFVKVGRLFRSMAPAVIYGMLAGIGILVFAGQFHVMVDDQPRENGIRSLLSIPIAIQKGIFPPDGSSHHLAAGLGLGTILIILAWTKLAPQKLKFIPGSLLAVAAATIAARAASLPVKYVDIPANLLSAVKPPGWETFSAVFAPEYIVAAITLAFVASAETLLSAAAVDQMHGGPRTNYDRELLAQGVGNTLAGLAGGLPMTGVIVRSATNVAAGARTRLSAILHGIWMLSLVAAFPWVLQLVPTASLAAVLVYTGYKLVNLQNIQKLRKYGLVPVGIYAATVILIVATDLLTGILVGIGLSLLKVLYALSHMDIRVSHDSAGRRIDVHLIGAATFIRMPKFVDTFDALPEHSEVHVHLDGLLYIDHACMEALAHWESKRADKRQRVIVEWDELMERYQSRHRGVPAVPLAEVASR
jgi:MFS superfamily sulfate permease-like transporter